MIGPTRTSRVFVLRFKAPEEPGIYPYVCTFPGHWVVMTGEMIVARELKDVDALLAARGTSTFVKDWTMTDLGKAAGDLEGRSVMRGMKSFMDARCNQCHAVGGHGAKFGPDLTKVAEKYRGARLLEQILQPSTELSENYRTYQIIKKNGEVVVGTILKEDDSVVQVITNLLTPDVVTTVRKKAIETRIASTLSSMPEGMLSTLTKEQILDLLAFLEAGGYQVPPGLRKNGHH